MAVDKSGWPSEEYLILPYANPAIAIHAFAIPPFRHLSPLVTPSHSPLHLFGIPPFSFLRISIHLQVDKLNYDGTPAHAGTTGQETHSVRKIFTTSAAQRADTRCTTRRTHPMS